MRRLCVCFVLFFTLIVNVIAPVAYSAEDTGSTLNLPLPELESEAAILIDAKTANILYEKDIHRRMYPASITKIMTAVLAIEKGTLSDVITVSESALAPLPYDGSSMALVAGEQLTLDSLLKGLMVASANDAANVIAEYISGDIGSFVVLMNERAKELGLNDTHFVNATGLHDENHYTTAYDIAMMCRYAMTIPKIRDTVDIAHIYIPESNLVNHRRYFISTNSLISRMRDTQYYYEPTIGIKTGHTSQAGNCLAAAAGKGKGYELISVTLKAPEKSGVVYSFVDTKKLFEYGYSNFKQVLTARPGEVLGEVKIKQANGQNYLSLVADEETRMLIHNGEKQENIEKKFEVPESVRAPVSKGQKIGEVSYFLNGVQLGKVNLVSDTDVARHPLWFVSGFFEFIWNYKAVRISAYILAAALAIYLILLGFGLSRAIKRSRRTDRHRYRKRRK